MTVAFLSRARSEQATRNMTLLDMFNQTALGWPPFVNQRFALFNSTWVAHMLSGVEL